MQSQFSAKRSPSLGLIRLGCLTHVSSWVRDSWAGFRMVFRVLLVSFAFICGVSEACAQAASNLPLLTNLFEVRSLSAAEAAKGYPVRLVAVLGGTPSIRFLHDGTSSCYIPNDKIGEVPTRAKLVIEGVTTAGDFAPFVTATNAQQTTTPHFTVLGFGELPNPKVLTDDNLLDPCNDCERVLLTGIVRTVEEHPKDDTRIIEMRVGSIPISVGCRGMDAIPGLFPGAVLQVTGNLGLAYNDRRQLRAGGFVYAYASELLVKSPGTDRPFELAVTPIAGLGQFKAEPLARLQRINGLVTAVRHGSGFFIEDRSGSTWIDHTETDGIRTGDELDLVGFRSIRRVVSSLDDCQIRKLGRSGLPPPLDLNTNSHLLGDFKSEGAKSLDGRRVRFVARVTETGSTTSAHVMALGGISRFVTAELPKSEKQPAFLPPQDGSTVEITGVYRLETNSRYGTTGGTVLVERPEDVRLVAPPPRNDSRVLFVARVSVAATVFLLIWAWILQRKRAQLQRLVREGKTKLSRQEQLFKKVIDLVPGILFVKDHEGRFLLINQGTVDQLGGGAADLVGKTDTEISPELCGFHGVLGSSRRQPDPGEESPVTEAHCRTADGRELWYHTITREIIGPNGKPALLVLAIDITLLKRHAAELERARLAAEEASRARAAMEDRLRQSQKMEAVGHLAGGVAHEFNNILAAILLNLHMVSRPGLEPESQEALVEIEKLSRRAAEVIKQLLAFSRQSVMRVEPTDWAACVEQQLRMLTRLIGARVRIEFRAARQLPLVSADRTTLEQVLLNLCLNARDAMANGGQLSITMSVREVSPEAADASVEHSPGQYVCMSVKDTGCGMDEATLKRLFEPFFTTKDVGQGTGLGLATIRGLIQQQHGWVDVESVLGQGSTFTVYLPASLEEAPPPSPVPERNSSLPSPGRILVVEDDPALCRPTEKLLEQAGWTVLVATNAHEALAVWRQHAESIDVLYSDIVMPGHLTGVDLAQRLLAEKPGLKVILTSGYNTELLNVNALTQGAITYVPKPCPPEILTGLIQRSLHGV